MRAALRLCPYLALGRVRRRGEATAAAGFTDMDKAQPVILAVTNGYTWHLWGPAGQPPAVLFHAAPWRWAVRLDYIAGTLTETGPQPL
jgi:hypothetical protein